MDSKQERKEQILDAIASPEKSIQFRDRKIELRGVDELQKALEITTNNGTPFHRRRHRAIFDKGV